MHVQPFRPLICLRCGVTRTESMWLLCCPCCWRAEIAFILFLVFWWPSVECITTDAQTVRLIHRYFAKGYPYHLVLCFLVALHGVLISLSTLMKILRQEDLRRKGCYSSVCYVRRCIMVSYTKLEKLEVELSCTGPVACVKILEVELHTCLRRNKAKTLSCPNIDYVTLVCLQR